MGKNDRERGYFFSVFTFIVLIIVTGCLKGKDYNYDPKKTVYFHYDLYDDEYYLPTNTTIIIDNITVGVINETIDIIPSFIGIELNITEGPHFFIIYDNERNLSFRGNLTFKEKYIIIHLYRNGGMDYYEEKEKPIFL